MPARYGLDGSENDKVVAMARGAEHFAGVADGDVDARVVDRRRRLTAAPMLANSRMAGSSSTTSTRSMVRDGGQPAGGGARAEADDGARQSGG